MLGIDLSAHDHTVWGWTIVAVYLAAAALSLAAGLARRRSLAGPARLEWFWYVFACTLVLLAINKQLDLQSELNGFGRHIAWDHGWYRGRGVWQTWFVRGVLVSGVVVAGALIVLYRRGTVQHWLAIAGLIGLLAFIAIRAASLHDIDAILFARRAADLNASRALELGGALLLAVAACWAAVTPASGRPPKPRAPAERPRPLARFPSSGER